MHVRSNRRPLIWVGLLTIFAGEGLVRKGARLAGFEVAGPDGVFVRADARIEDATVVVSSAEVTSPIRVRCSSASSANAIARTSVADPKTPV